MAVPLIRAVGTVAAAAGAAISPGLPAGTVAGDGLIMVVETTTADTLTASGWVVEFQANGGSTTRLTVLSRIATGTDATTTSTPANHAVGRIIGIQAGTFDPADFPHVVGAGNTQTTTVSVSITGINTTKNDCLVIACSAGDLPDAVGTAEFSSPANASLTNVTERIDNSTNTGNGGAILMITGDLATAGATGTTTATAANTAVRSNVTLSVCPPGAATVTPAVVATTTTIPTPTILAASRVTPAVVLSNVSVPTPSVIAASNVTPAAVATVTTVPTPTVSAGAVVTPAVVATVVTVPTPTVAAGPTVVTPAVVAATTTVPTPTITAGASVTPATVTTTTTTPNPTVAGEGIGNPTTVAAVFTVPSPLIQSGAVVTPTVVAATMTVPTPQVEAQATVTPVTVATTTTVPTPVGAGGGLVTPATVASSFAVPTPTIQAGDTLVTPLVVAATVTVPTPTIIAGGHTVILPPVVTIRDADPRPGVGDSDPQVRVKTGNREAVLVRRVRGGTIS